MRLPLSRASLSRAAKARRVRRKSKYNIRRDIRDIPYFLRLTLSALRAADRGQCIVFDLFPKTYSSDTARTIARVASVPFSLVFSSPGRPPPSAPLLFVLAAPPPCHSLRGLLNFLSFPEEIRSIYFGGVVLFGADVREK